MKSPFTRSVALTFALIAGIAGSALPFDTVGKHGAGYGQVHDRFEITSLIFVPKQLDAMKDILSDLHLKSQTSEAGLDGVYVLDRAVSTKVVSALQEKGEVQRQLHVRGSLSDDSKATSLSMLPGRFFSARLKTHYITSVKNLPPALIIDYSLNVAIEPSISGTSTKDNSIPLRYNSGGSVLLPINGAFMRVIKIDNGVFIWLISAN